jgi:hypothetical protein
VTDKPRIPRELWEEILREWRRWEGQRLDGCLRIDTHWRGGRMLKAHVIPQPVWTAGENAKKVP